MGKDKLVVDISCKKREGGWVVAMNGWKTLTDTWVNQGTSPAINPLLISIPHFIQSSDQTRSLSSSASSLFILHSISKAAVQNLGSGGGKVKLLTVFSESIRLIEDHCSELLIHAADVEGLCQGIDQELVERLGEWVRLPCTYAGGAKG